MHRVHTAISIMAQTMSVNIGVLRAAKYVHNRLLSSVLHWPATTFDKIPSGRIINRFGSDVDTLDNSMPGSVQQCLAYVAVVRVKKYSQFCSFSPNFTRLSLRILIAGHVNILRHQFQYTGVSLRSLTPGHYLLLRAGECVKEYVHAHSAQFILNCACFLQ